MGSKHVQDAQDPARQVVRAEQRDGDWDHEEVVEYGVVGADDFSRYDTDFDDDEWEDYFDSRYRYAGVDFDTYDALIDSGVLVVPLIDVIRLSSLRV